MMFRLDRLYHILAIPGLFRFVNPVRVTGSVANINLIIRNTGCKSYVMLFYSNTPYQSVIPSGTKMNGPIRMQSLL